MDICLVKFYTIIFIRVNILILSLISEIHVHQTKTDFGL